MNNIDLKYFTYAPISLSTEIIIASHNANLYRLATLAAAYGMAKEDYKDFKIKQAYRKPFLEKLYEMKGRV